MSDSYLKIAEKAIKEVNRPLHPKEIIQCSIEGGFLPTHLFGKTQFKTLAARLSTEIRSNTKSKFFRTGANRFFLWELKTDKHKVHRAVKRTKTLHNEMVLTVPNDFLLEHNFVGLFNNINDLISLVGRTGCGKYIIRKEAEKREDVKQLVSYALVVQNDRILTYRRGVFNNAADEIVGLRSIGFGGHIDELDLDLFDVEGLGIIGNARRELSEELIFDEKEQTHAENKEAFNLLCGINTYETLEAKKHIAITIVYKCSEGFSPTKNELSINDLRWSYFMHRENLLKDFEPWSKTILEALYSDRIKIG